MPSLAGSSRRRARLSLLTVITFALVAPHAGGAPRALPPSAPPPSTPEEPFLSPLPQGTPYVLPTSELPTPGLDPAGDVATGQGLEARHEERQASRAEPATGLFQCDRRYVWVANEPAGLVTGNCSFQDRFTRTVKSDPVAPTSSYYDGGLIGGPFNGCGWVRYNLDRKIGERTSTACSSASRPRASFTSSVNCAPGACSDGSPVEIVSRCYEYANVRPWSTATGPVGGTGAYIRYRDPGAGRLRWRYITKYNDYVLVRDQDVGEGEGNWVFVPRSCLRL